MSISKEEKKQCVKKFGNSEKDCGRSEVQVSIFTHRIKKLTEHFKIHKKDNHSRYGLIALVNARRKLLDYIKQKDQERYQKIIEKLGIRR